ncbi:MAG: enoyl-ACP reductase FabI [Microthrixaceae bacterium]
MSTLLEGKRLLVTGVVNTDSIAFAVAEAALRNGAEVALSVLGRDLERAREATRSLPGEVRVIELDLTDEAGVARASALLAEQWDHLDGALHAVAFAPRDALAGDFLAAAGESTELAFRTSAYSYALLARLLVELAPEEGASLVGLDFDAAGAWPVYNWMGVCKAALESASRYVARDLGARHIRSNLVAAGPLHTRAAGGIPEFRTLTDAWAARAALTWDDRDASPVADAVCFLLSDLARGITGEILHVDGGYHAMAANLR